DDSRVQCVLSGVQAADRGVVDGVILTTTVRMPDESVYTRRLALFGPVEATSTSTSTPSAAATETTPSTPMASIPVKCAVSKFKIEVPLRKLPLAPGLPVPTWGRLEYDAAAAAVTALPKAGTGQAGAAAGAAPSGDRPYYPSSKAPRRDW